ncbi:MAG: TonB-dependent receptor [bacterium]|nr:TonB-dependent receptor [bacterium]
MKYCSILLMLLLISSIKPSFFSFTLSAEPLPEKKNDAPIDDDLKEMLGMSLKELSNIKITSATKFGQMNNEASSLISVITKDQVHDFGWKSLNEILSVQPGFFSTLDYERKAIGSRGLFEGWNNNHLLLLIDGVPYNDSLYGTAYTWDITPIIFINTLEIIRGPASSLYGSNATNGLLNIKTPSAKDLKGNSTIRGRFGFILVDNFTLENTLVTDAIGGYEGGMFDLVLSFTYNRDPGNDFKSLDDRMDNTKYRITDRNSSHYVFVKVEGKEYLKGLSLQFHQQSWDFQTEYGWYFRIPDLEEKMHESRQIFTLKYTKDIDDLGLEFVAQYERHNIDWNVNFAEPGAWTNSYPAGAWEFLSTKADDLFFRAQASYRLPGKIVILSGIESNIFYYGGDNEHFANFDTVSGAANPDGAMKKLGDWLELATGNPVTNIAGFLQVTSGDIFSKYLQVTAGIRYDTTFFKYNISGTNNKKEKDFYAVSPRLALVFLPIEDLSIKLLGGLAFRAPTPTDMFTANTWTFASNIEGVEAEKIRTAELAVDYKINKNFIARLNGYLTQSLNQIAFHPDINRGNLTTNLYDLTTTGCEAELIFAIARISGFVNISFAKRIDEVSLTGNNPNLNIDFTTPHDDTVTWAPSLVANLGVVYKIEDIFTTSFVLHYHGKQERKDSDRYPYSDSAKTIDTFAVRGSSIAPWIDLDLNIFFTPLDYLEIGINATNVLGGKNTHMKPGPYVFDHIARGRRVLLNAALKF